MKRSFIQKRTMIFTMLALLAAGCSFTSGLEDTQRSLGDGSNACGGGGGAAGSGGCGQAGGGGP